MARLESPGRGGGAAKQCNAMQWLFLELITGCMWPEGPISFMHTGALTPPAGAAAAVSAHAYIYLKLSQARLPGRQAGGMRADIGRTWQLVRQEGR